MAYQSVFKRYELKYLLTREQKQRLLEDMAPYMAPDSYGRTTVRNLYFDTESYRLIRHSIERPVYKEKLRLRSYRQLTGQESVFVELKKKYKTVVYKRRLAMPQEQAFAFLAGGPCPVEGQIANELAYFRDYYGDLKPKVFLSYHREAYYGVAGGEFRITFDDDILCRRELLSLALPVWGTPILSEDMVLMELKSPGGIPLWLTQVLTRERIYKTSFSKYGTAYQKLIFKGDHQYA